MSKDMKSKKYAGVYYRDLESGDRSYYIRLKIDGKTRRFHIGKKSEGITEAFCSQEKARILNAHRFGEDVANQLRKVKKEDPTFGDLFEWYIGKRELKASTVEHLQILRKVPFWNERKITREMVQAYLDWMVAQNKRPATVTLRYRQIRAVFRYAIAREKYKHADPTVGIDLPKSTGARKRYLTPEEVERLLDAVRHDERLYLFVKMSLCTGARMGTILSVHSDHIQDDGTVRLYNHKCDRWYTGFFDEETMRLVNGKRGYVLALKGKEDNVPAHQSVQYKLQAILNDLFNTDDTPREERAYLHTIRHSVGTQLVRNGVPLQTIARVLDHANLSSTQIYAKVPESLVKKSVTNMWD